MCSAHESTPLPTQSIFLNPTFSTANECPTWSEDSGSNSRHSDNQADHLNLVCDTGLLDHESAVLSICERSHEGSFPPSTVSPLVLANKELARRLSFPDEEMRVRFSYYSVIAASKMHLCCPLGAIISRHSFMHSDSLLQVVHADI